MDKRIQKCVCGLVYVRENSALGRRNSYGKRNERTLISDYKSEGCLGNAVLVLIMLSRLVVHDRMAFL